MPQIYVNTDNTDPKEKLYVATLAGQQAAACEQMMKDTIVKAIAKDPTFTTVKMAGAKGYSIRLKIATLNQTPAGTSCSLSGEILLYPKVTYSKKGAGSLMLTTNMTGSATATGRFAAVDCVVAITETLVKKALPIMRSHMASSR